MKPLQPPLLAGIRQILGEWPLTPRKPSHRRGRPCGVPSPVNAGDGSLARATTRVAPTRFVDLAHQRFVVHPRMTE